MDSYICFLRINVVTDLTLLVREFIKELLELLYGEDCVTQQQPNLYRNDLEPTHDGFGLYLHRFEH